MTCWSVVHKRVRNIFKENTKCEISVHGAPVRSEIMSVIERGELYFSNTIKERASQMCSRQKRFVEAILVPCWPTVYDVGPTWKHHSLPNTSNVINLHHPQKIKQKHLKYISFFSDEQIFLLSKMGTMFFYDIIRS